MYANSEISFLFIVLCDYNFHPPIPYIVLLPEDGHASRSTLQNAPNFSKNKKFRFDWHFCFFALYYPGKIWKSSSIG